MALKPMDEGVVEREQATLSEKFAAPSYAYDNIEQIRRLATQSTFEHDGHTYLVPRVPYDVGLEMNNMYLQIKHGGERPDLEQIGYFGILFKKMMEMAWRELIVPKSRWRRIRKRLGLLKNPLHTMSEGELVGLLGFFLVRRMMSNVTYR